jgi:hypothetical protein
MIDDEASFVMVPRWHLDAIDRSCNGAQKIILSFNAATKAQAAPRSESPGQIVVTFTWKRDSGDDPQIRSHSKSESLPAIGHAPNYAVMASLMADPDPVEAGQSSTSESKTLSSNNQTNGLENQSAIASNKSNSVLAGPNVVLAADAVLNQTARETNQNGRSNEAQSPSVLEDTSALADIQTVTASNQTANEDNDATITEEDQDKEITPEVAATPASPK